MLLPLNEILVAIFLIYIYFTAFNMISLMSCDLQRFIANNLIFKHSLLFISIYLFTYIYQIYSIKSIKKYQVNDDIFSWRNLLFTILIYITFIISSKNTLPVLLTIIFILSIIFLLEIYTENYLTDTHSIDDDISLENYYINYVHRNELKLNHSDIDGNKIDQKLFIYDLSNLLYILIYIILIIGFIIYLRKQYKDHGKHWDTLKFIFGTNKCTHT